MVKAIWNGAILAESDETVIVEGNHYFPADSIRREHFRESDTHTTCPWKGLASYYHIEVNGQVNRDAAWYYPTARCGQAYRGTGGLLARREGRGRVARH
jgi:uncharacterized protein (DUF427 family)